MGAQADRQNAADRRPAKNSKRQAERRDGGQSLVEFALIIPILIILVFGIIDFGMGLRAYITVAQATREGARYAAVGNPAGTFSSGGSGDCNGSTNTSTVGKVCSTLNGMNLSNVQTVAVTYPQGNGPGNPVRVHAQYDYHYITPVNAIVNFFSGGAMGDTITVSSTTDMRLE
jgi:Flp pilus assembly protein TadG